MFRSFTDRLLGGVCGGLAASLRVNVWIIRALFVALTIASLGIFAVLYVLLWWITPQESLIAKRRGGLPVFFALLLVLLAFGVWAGRDLGWLQAANGESLYLPLLVGVVGLVFFLRQVRA
jgi:phage shock protein PspC (stress-responsive transcriptional regulator)